MQGIILTSHGEMAKGLLQTTTLFFGQQPQLKAFCLMPDDNPDDFGEILKKGMAEVDTGDGVIVMCDMLFGTPCNQMVRNIQEDLDNDKVQVLCGMNLAMALQALAMRESGKVTTEDLLENAKQGVADLKAILKEGM